MVIKLTKIKEHETKFTIETKYRDTVLWDFMETQAEALNEARNQIKLINFFRMNEHD